MLRPAGVLPNRVSPVLLTEAILEMVRSNRGVAVLAHWAAAPYVERGQVRAVQAHPPRHPASVVSRRARGGRGHADDAKSRRGAARAGGVQSQGAAVDLGMTRRFLLALIFVAQLISLEAQSARSAAVQADAVDRFIAAEMERRHIPGVSLAVLRDGKEIKTQGYGVADLEHGIAVTPETVFKIGSVSKQFLATGIMLLAQDGRLTVDDPIAKHLDGVPESWRQITLRHFLTHTSGVVREGPAFDALKVQPDMVVIRSAFALPLEFPTGSKYQYCNVCYFALAEVIARAVGQAVGDVPDRARLCSDGDVGHSHDDDYSSGARTRAWVRVAERAISECRGVPCAATQRRVPVDGARHGAMGCRAVSGPRADAGEPRGDVEADIARRRRLSPTASGGS